jgi:hypothetical protein
MNKVIITVVVIGICLVLAAIASSSWRRSLPFQEVVALDRGIAVVNAQQWFMDSLRVSLYHDGGQLEKAAFDERGVCVFPDLVNGQEYVVEISRTDLKGRLLYKKLRKTAIPHEGGDEYYVLVGASVGRSWNLGELPERLHLGKRMVFGTRTVYQFDKSKVVDDLVHLPFPVAGVILKECSAYFPRDLEAGEKQLTAWVDKLRQHGIRPILATTVPVTAGRAAKEPGKQESLLLFNDFIRRYTEENHFGLLDLEKALRIGDADRHLRDDYAQEDGTHLVEKAYSEALDKIILPSLVKGNKAQSSAIDIRK